MSEQNRTETEEERVTYAFEEIIKWNKEKHEKKEEKEEKEGKEESEGEKEEEKKGEEKGKIGEREKIELKGMISKEKGRRALIMTRGFASNKESGTIKEIIKRVRRIITNKEIINKKIINKEITTIRYDIYGHGESQGEFSKITVEKGVNSLLSTIKEASRRGYDEIILYGSSFGGLITYLTIANMREWQEKDPQLRRVKIKKAILRAPLADFTKDIEFKKPDEMREWREKGYTTYKVYSKEGIKEEKIGLELLDELTDEKSKKRASAYEEAEQIKEIIDQEKIKVMIIHGEEDKIVPIIQSEKMSQKIGARLIRIKEAGHSFKEKKERYEEHLKKIIEAIIEE